MRLQISLFCFDCYLIDKGSAGDMHVTDQPCYQMSN